MNDDLAAKIRQRAYFIWEAENRPEGKHLEHWLCAEAQIGAEHAQAIGQPEQRRSGQPTSTVAETAGAAPKPVGRAKRRTA